MPTLINVIIAALPVVGGGIVGGLIVVLFKFGSNVWRDRLKEGRRKKTEMELEGRRQRYGVRRVQADRFAETQYEKYLELWKCLQSLRLTVDALWNKVTPTNLVMFSNQVTSTKQKVADWSLFFEEHHLRELQKILLVLDNFRSGKERLAEFRYSDNVIFYEAQITEQIEDNREYKLRFEAFLDELNKSFRERLSEIDDPQIPPLH